MTGALPYDRRPEDATPVSTADLPPTPLRDRNIPATAWREAPPELLRLGDDLPGRPVATYKRRIGPWILWRAGSGDARRRPLLGRTRRRPDRPAHVPALPRRLGRRPRTERRAPRPLPGVEGRSRRTPVSLRATRRPQVRTLAGTRHRRGGGRHPATGPAAALRGAPGPAGGTAPPRRRP